MGRQSAPTGSAIGGEAEFRVEDHPLTGETHFSASGHVRLWGYLAPVVSEINVGGRHHPRRVYHPSDLRLTAPDVAITRAPDEDIVIRSLSISDQVLEDALGAPSGELVDSFARLQQFTFNSPIIGAVTQQLRRVGEGACEGGSHVDCAYVDALLHTVAHELRRVARMRSPDKNAPGKGRLSAAELRRLNAVIDAGLGAKLHLRDLAASLGMPLATFQDAVKRTTGKTAYQHLMQRRLLAARRLIEGSDEPLAQIAFETGFTSQSRMTDVFKEKLGATPGVLRKVAKATG